MNTKTYPQPFSTMKKVALGLAIIVIGFFFIMLFLAMPGFDAMSPGDQVKAQIVFVVVSVCIILGLLALIGDTINQRRNAKSRQDKKNHNKD